MLQFWPYFFWLSLLLYAAGSLLKIVFALKPHPFWGRSGLILSWLAFASHTAFLLLRSIAAAQAPLSGLFASLNFFIWCLGVFYFTYGLRKQLHSIGIIVLPLISLLLFISSKAPTAITPLPVALKTVWFEIHVSTAFISYALFGVGASAAFLNLLPAKRRQLILPADELVEDFTYRSLAWGFLTFSISMVSGGVWAYLAWSDYWVWTPKELWSSIIWVYYSTYLHARLTRGWQGKRCQLLAVTGFIIVLFTYLGVGLLMKSSHPL